MTTFDDVISGKGEFTIFGFSPGPFEIKEPADWITCQDGTRLSVQASRTAYCAPRTNHGPYSEVEVGYPSVAPPETWAQYCTSDRSPEAATESIYAYIPVELVRAFIEAHGGEVPQTEEPE